MRRPKSHTIGTAESREEARVCTGADTAHIVTVAWAVRSASVGRDVVLCHRTFRPVPGYTSRLHYEKLTMSNRFEALRTDARLLSSFWNDESSFECIVEVCE